MRDRALGVLKRVTGTFGAFTPGQKAVTLFGIVALVVGGVLFANWASTPAYAPLFSNLSSTEDRKSTRLNSSHSQISYAVFCLKKKKRSADRGIECRARTADPARVRR